MVTLWILRFSDYAIKLPIMRQLWNGKEWISFKRCRKIKKMFLVEYNFMKACNYATCIKLPFLMITQSQEKSVTFAPVLMLKPHETNLKPLVLFGTSQTNWLKP